MGRLNLDMIWGENIIILLALSVKADRSTFGAAGICDLIVDGPGFRDID
jgi:hypothetical protein